MTALFSSGKQWVFYSAMHLIFNNQSFNLKGISMTADFLEQNYPQLGTSHPTPAGKEEFCSFMNQRGQGKLVNPSSVVVTTFFQNMQKQEPSTHSNKVIDVIVPDMLETARACMPETTLTGKVSDVVMKWMAGFAASYMTEEQISKYSSPTDAKKFFPQEHLKSLTSRSPIQRASQYSLSQFLASDSVLSRKQVLEIATCITTILINMHGKDLAHGGFEDSNICVQECDGVTRVSFCDFDESNRKFDRNNIQSFNYIAPELVQEAPASYSKKTDIWAFGVLLHTLLTKKNSFSFDNLQKFPNKNSVINNLKDRIKKGYYFKKLYFQRFSPPEQQLLTLIEKCLHGDPDLRPTIEEVAVMLKEIPCTPENWSKALSFLKV